MTHLLFLPCCGMWWTQGHAWVIWQNWRGGEVSFPVAYYEMPSPAKKGRVRRQSLLITPHRLPPKSDCPTLNLLNNYPMCYVMEQLPAYSTQWLSHTLRIYNNNYCLSLLQIPLWLVSTLHLSLVQSWFFVKHLVQLTSLAHWILPVHTKPRLKLVQ